MKDLLTNIRSEKCSKMTNKLEFSQKLHRILMEKLMPASLYLTVKIKVLRRAPVSTTAEAVFPVIQQSKLFVKARKSLNLARSET